MSVRFYMYGDGAVWRMPHAVVRFAARLREDGGDAYDYILQHSRMLSAESNWRTGRWSNLPKGIVQEENRLWSAASDAQIVSYDDYEDTVVYWRDRYLISPSDV